MLTRSPRRPRFALYASIFAAIVPIFSTLPAPAQHALDFRTPLAGPSPRINGPKIYGVRPGHPFLYRIPCTGTRPIHFSVENLHSTLTLDPRSGFISGTTPAAGEYRLLIRASNSFGHAERVFTIVSGNTIALTPQMGWNDWYTY